MEGGQRESSLKQRESWTQIKTLPWSPLTSFSFRLNAIFAPESNKRRRLNNTNSALGNLLWKMEDSKPSVLPRRKIQIYDKTTWMTNRIETMHRYMAPSMVPYQIALSRRLPFLLLKLTKLKYFFAERLKIVFDGDNIRSYKLICPKCRRVNPIAICSC